MAKRVYTSTRTSFQPAWEGIDNKTRARYLRDTARYMAAIRDLAGNTALERG